MADKVEHVLDNGITYELKLAAKMTTNNGGYMGVVLQGNLYYPKITLEKGVGQTVIPGGGCSTPREAALRIAKYLASPYPIAKCVAPTVNRGLVAEAGVSGCCTARTAPLVCILSPDGDSESP